MKVSAKKAMSLLIIGVLAIIVTGMMADDVNKQDAILFSNCAIFACLAVYVKFTGGFDMSAIMIIFAWAFSVAGLIPELFDLTDRCRVIGYYSDSNICHACLFVAMSVCLFTIGAILAHKKKKSMSIMGKIFMIDDSTFVLISKVFFYIGLAPMAVYLLQCLIYVAASGYGASLYNDGVITDGSWFISLKNYFLIGVYMLIVAYGKEKAKQAKWVMLVGFMYCLAMIVIGQRLTIVAYLIGLIACYHYSVESIAKYKWRILFTVLLAVLVLPVLSSYRLIARNEWNIAGIIEQINPLQGLMDMLSETSGSMLPLLDCMSNSTLQNMHLRGASYLECIVLSVMFKSVVRFFYNPGYSSLQVLYTQTVAPAIARVGGGLGFSAFAEAYINFHDMGCLLFILFGYLYTNLYQSIRVERGQAGRIWLPLSLFLCQRLLFYVRSDMYDFYGNFKLVLMIIVLCYILTNLTMKKAK